MDVEGAGAHGSVVVCADGVEGCGEGGFGLGCLVCLLVLGGHCGLMYIYVYAEYICMWVYDEWMICILDVVCR